MDFSILFVCTGNICRSPAAEVLFRARVNHAAVQVSSAGTSGLSGHEMDAPSAYMVKELGVDPSGHIARRLTPEMVADADVILTAATAHRSAVVQLDPPAFRRTFTMREFGRLGQEAPFLNETLSPATLRTRIALIADRRGLLDPVAPGADDIADPFGAGIDAARTAIRAVSTAVDGVVDALGLAMDKGQISPSSR